MAKYNHIEIMREELVRQYKFKPNPKPPRPPVRNRGQHGEKLREQLENTLGEGIDYPDLRAFTVQFHPEACTGPKDTSFLFDQFVDLMKGGDR